MIKPCVLAIAEYAGTGDADKLNVMSIFDSICVDVFPTRHHQMYLVARFLADHDNFSNDHKIEYKLIAEDENEILISIDAKAVFEKPINANYGIINTVILVKSIEFKHPGTYFFKVFIDGIEEGFVPLTVVQRIRKETDVVTPKAEKLLEDARRSASGWSISQLKSLYTGYGFDIINKSKHDWAQHPKFPMLLATLPRHNQVKAVYVKEAITLIERLLTLEAIEAQKSRLDGEE